MIRYENLTLTELDEGTLAVTFCDKDAVRVTVPDKIDGKTVSAIGEEAFKDCKRLIREFHQVSRRKVLQVNR